MKLSKTLLVIIYLVFSQLSGNAQDKKKPNVLFIFADDHCYEALSHLGSQVKTPNLDKLAGMSTHFTHAYNQGSWTGAVCIASRTQLVSGKAMWGAAKVDKLAKKGKYKQKTWPELMKGLGYETYMSGKWHVKIKAEKVFDHVVHERPGMPKQTEEGYNRPIKGKEDVWQPWDKSKGGFWEGGTHWSEVLAADGTKFIQQASKSDKPFFMYLAFNAPHDPRQAPKSFVDMYPANKVRVPKDFVPRNPYATGMAADEKVRDERLAPFPRTKYSIQVNRREYYALITHMDEQIGKLLDALEKTGQKDNTYIVFTADHGLAVGHHGLVGKQNLYDHSVRVPFYIAGPNVPKNKKISERIYLQDVVPTTIELAGGKVPNYVDFKTLNPLIEGKKEAHYPVIYGAFKDKQKMLTKGDWKLIYYPAIDKKLLFNIKKDPQERKDLSEKSKYQEKLKEMTSELEKTERDLKKKVM